MDFFGVSLLNQQSTSRYVGPLVHIILITDKESMLLFLNTVCLAENFIVLGLTWLGLKPTIYCTLGEHTNHYTTDAVLKIEEDISIVHVHLYDVSEDFAN